MPFYISEASVTDRYGEDFHIHNADRDSDGDADPLAVADAIADAEAEINSYLALCYTLPLPGVTALERTDA